MDARDSPPVSEVLGRYAIYGVIASGGMATVHFGRLAGPAGFSRTVAIKRLHAHLANDPDFHTTMLNEARLAARIHHPNVVPTLDIVAANGELLVVMEYVRGESLSRLIAAEAARGRRVPLRIASAIVIGALHGLHAAHEARSDQGNPLGIVHRDVSPQNILVGVDGVARVIDFGVAKAAGRAQTTSTGVFKGKVAYMAPEQLAAGDESLATGEVTRVADVYSAGALLWEMLAGRRLFPGQTDAHRAIQVLIGAKDPPSRYGSDLHPLLDAIVMKALALDPADRFATAMEMAETLLDVVPPAFSTEVSKWVEDVAKESLTRRESELAQIERLSDPTIVSVAPAFVGAPPSRDRAVSSSRGLAVVVPHVEELQTVSSQPSTLSVESPGIGAARSKSRWRARVVGLGGTLLVAASVAAFLSRGPVWHRASLAPLSVVVSAEGDRPRVVAPASLPAPSASATVAETSAPFVPSVPLSSLPIAPLPVASASSPASPRGPSPARGRPKSRPAPKPEGPFRFAEPD